MFLDEILLIIFSFLSFKDKKSAWLVSRQFRRVVLTILAPNSLFIKTISGQLSEEVIEQYIDNRVQLTETIFWLCINDKIKLLELFTSTRHSIDVDNLVFHRMTKLMFVIGKENIAHILERRIIYRQSRKRICSKYTFEDFILFKKDFASYIYHIDRFILDFARNREVITLHEYLWKY
jgi:hypothetical protein